MPRKIATLESVQRSGSSQESVLTESAAPGKEASPEALAHAARAMRLIQQAQGRPGVMASVQDPFSSLLQTTIAKYAASGPAAGDDLGREVKFDEHDVFRWAASVVFTWWKKINKFTFTDPSTLVQPIANTARVAVFGDWGTGLYGALKIRDSIAADGKYQMVLHLGDTYYSGDDEEVDDGLIGPWPKVDGAINRALIGNHEMYTGGEAYFKAVNAKFGQKSTYFAYQNDHFILACLDSSYADHDLHGNQAAWVGKLLAQADGRKLILFSHHQPFSLLDSQGPKLVAQLSPYLIDRKIFAWYWGHEHRCALYDAHPKWGLLGRCIGHGGFPAFRDTFAGAGGPTTKFVKLPSQNLVPGALVLDGPNPDITGHEDTYSPHGYVTLRFDGPRLTEEVLSSRGVVLNTLDLVK